jgi:hypothetical protein
MRFAIPSYNRIKELGEKSLHTLAEHGITPEEIDIFVVKEEFDAYENEYPEHKFHIGPLGMKNIRNFIFQEFYDEGDKVVSMDDDIDKIRMKNPKGWEASCYEDCELNLRAEIDLAFKECEKSGRHLWGLYPVENHFFMKNDISYDYKFCGGWMWGCIVDKESLLVGTDQYEDYERCIRHYLKDGGMIRLNYLCCKTKYINEGGMGKDRKFEEAQNYLQNNYGDLFYLKKKKGGLNPVLKDLRKIKSM